MTCELNTRRFQWCITQAYSPKGVAKRVDLMNFGVWDSDHVLRFLY